MSIEHLSIYIAAGSKASAGLLKLLGRAHPTACDVQDVEGKTPLHILCDSSSVLFEEDLIDDRQPPPTLDVVAALLSCSLYPVTLEDDEDMSPLEHAIMSNASIKTVKLLQVATKKGMQLKKKLLKNEGKSSFVTTTTATTSSSCLQVDAIPSQ